MITARTRICGLIGDPVGHSMSPAMHNAAFSSLGLDYAYLPFRVEKERLASAIEGVRALGIRGLNVTIPHKVAVMPFLDGLDPLAERIGAVNTIVNDNGHLQGYNTDAGGFLKALLAGGIEPDGKRVVILGAGGASRAVSFALAERGAAIVILNRPPEMDWAVELAASLSRFSDKGVRALELNEQNLRAVLEPADILVNATSVGMSPNVSQTPVAKGLLRSGLVVFDVIYNPVTTRLLAEAREVGAEAIGGLDMLVWQGALAFEMWTGLKAPVDIMKAEATRALAGAPKPAAKAGKTAKKSTKTSVALIGFMAAGKTAVGRYLAEKLDKRLVELDSLIEQRAGKSVAEIFKDGEVAFRQLEIETTREVAANGNQVIACGGGIVLNKINIDRLKEEAVVVYLVASAGAILERVSADSTVRPLLENRDKALTIRELLKLRQPFYERAADIRIDTSELDIRAVAEKVLAKLEEYEGFN